MSERTILLQELRLRDKYYNVSVAVYDRFVPDQYRSLEITHHLSRLWVKLQGRTKTLAADLSLGQQAVYSERALTPRWMAYLMHPKALAKAVVSLVTLSPTSTLCHVIRDEPHTPAKLRSVPTTSNGKWKCYSRGMGSSLVESQSVPTGLKYE